MTGITTPQKLAWYDEHIAQAQALREKYIVTGPPSSAAVAQEEVARLMAEKAIIQLSALARGERVTK